MSHSAALRVSDFRAIYQLVGECRELGDDPVVWRLHFIAQLGRLTGVGFGIAAEMGGCVRGPRRDMGTTVWGAESRYDLIAWGRVLATFQRNPLHNPLINNYVARMVREPGVCLARSDVVSDRDWNRSDYVVLHRSVGVDETLVCFCSIHGASDEVSEIFLGRDIGDRNFSARDRAIAREAMAAVSPLVGGPLARFGEPSPGALPPRAREVLRCFLEGDSDKQVGARLGLTRHTVNQYAKAIYAHFGVGSRAELLARWVRRGWGGRCAWADG